MPREGACVSHRHDTISRPRGRLSFVACFCENRSDHLNTPADTALGVDDLSAVLRAHPGTEAELPGAFHLADSVRVMHGRLTFKARMPQGMGRRWLFVRFGSAASADYSSAMSSATDV